MIELYRELLQVRLGDNDFSLSFPSWSSWFIWLASRLEPDFFAISTIKLIWSLGNFFCNITAQFICRRGHTVLQKKKAPFRHFFHDFTCQLFKNSANIFTSNSTFSIKGNLEETGGSRQIWFNFLVGFAATVWILCDILWFCKKALIKCRPCELNKRPFIVLMIYKISQGFTSQEWN